MITLLTIALLILRIALTLVLNSLRISLKALRAGVKVVGKTAQVASAHRPRQAAMVRVGRKSLEVAIRMLEWVLKLLDALVGLFLTSLVGVVVLIVILVLSLVISTLVPFMVLSEEDGGFPRGSSTSSSTSNNGGRSGNSGDPHKWDFEVVPFEEVTNIPDYIVNNPAYMEGLTDDSKYVIRVLNGKYPDHKLISLYRRGDRLAHGKGKAIDFGTEGDPGWEQMHWLADNAEKLKISELIYQTHYWNCEEPEEFGYSMGHTGNITADHYDHIHISVDYFARHGDGDAPVYTELCPVK